MADNRNKRTLYNVSDVISGGNSGGGTRAKFKSGYSGPKKAPSGSPRRDLSSAKPAAASPSVPATSHFVHKSGGILDYAWIAYCAALAIAFITAVLAYSFGSKIKGIYYPQNVVTISGVVNDIFEDYSHGGLGSGYSKRSSVSSQTAPGSQGGTASASGEQEGTSDPDDNSSLLGESASSSTPNSTTGATMALDTGSAYGSYSSATSHEQLLEQLDQALAANDAGFVGTKLAYEDTESKNLIGYPQSVVEHFTKYMSDNPDKRANFLAEVKDGSQFSAKNGSAYIVKLPLLQFTINMGYDGTTISISGFSDQKMDSGQSAVVSPLLPCMYEIHAETAKGSQTSEVECNMNEGNLKINIGVTN